MKMKYDSMRGSFRSVVNQIRMDEYEVIKELKTKYAEQTGVGEHTESVYESMKGRMDKLNSEMEQRKKMFGLFASGNVDFGTAEEQLVSKKVDEFGIGSSEEEDNVNDGIDEALEKDKFGESE